MISKLVVNDFEQGSVKISWFCGMLQSQKSMFSKYGSSLMSSLVIIFDKKGLAIQKNLLLKKNYYMPKNHCMRRKSL